MCGDGTNDAPALRQAQIGIAVSSATDVAKAAAGMVMTEPGLAGIMFAVREGRAMFQRLVTYTFNMLVKKVEIVLFLAAGLVLTGEPVMTPALMVLMLATNDFLAMSLTTDRASFAPSPGVWRSPRPDLRWPSIRSSGPCWRHSGLDKSEPFFSVCVREFALGHRQMVHLVMRAAHQYPDEPESADVRGPLFS
jgi:magnesium-transporting ATPase (P-type)